MPAKSYHAKIPSGVCTPSLSQMRRMCIDHMESEGEIRMTIYAAHTCKRVEGHVVYDGNRYLWETPTGRMHMILADGGISRKTL